MTIQKYSINNIFKLTLIISIILSTANSVLANDDPSKTPEESLKTPELTDEENAPPSEDSSPQQESEDTNTNSDNGNSDRNSDTEQPIQNSNPEISARQELFTLKNILLIFAIIDLPIIALLLAFWFCDRKEQKQKFNYLINGQNKIDRKLKQLETITSKLEESDNSQNKITKRIEENRQEIINSRIELLSAYEKKQSERLNSDDNINVASNNYNSFPSFIKEPTEQQLDLPSHNSVAVIEQIPQFVDRYNLNKKSLSNEVIETVSATKESLSERRSGKSDTLILEPTSQKKYCIVREDSNYYLVPHAKIKIDEYNKTTFESLFECINFNSDYTDFYLIEPAKVSQLNSESWQLEKKGKLEFS